MDSTTSHRADKGMIQATSGSCCEAKDFGRVRTNEKLGSLDLHNLAACHDCRDPRASKYDNRSSCHTERKAQMKVTREGEEEGRGGMRWRERGKAQGGGKEQPNGHHSH
eukprot:755854-Hanusia_phi.AAC.4